VFEELALRYPYVAGDLVIDLVELGEHQLVHADWHAAACVTLGSDGLQPVEALEDVGNPVRLPNSPSLGMSIPTSTCRATTSTTASRSASSNRSSSYGSPNALARSAVVRLVGLHRLPTCVVAILLGFGRIAPHHLRKPERRHPALRPG